MIRRYQWHRIWRVLDWMMPHSSSFGRAGPGALADVAADPLGVVRPAGEQFGIRGLDFLRIGGAVVIQQNAMGVARSVA